MAYIAGQVGNPNGKNNAGQYVARGMRTIREHIIKSWMEAPDGLEILRTLKVTDPLQWLKFIGSSLPRDLPSEPQPIDIRVQIGVDRPAGELPAVDVAALPSVPKQLQSEAVECEDSSKTKREIENGPA